MFNLPNSVQSVVINYSCYSGVSIKQAKEVGMLVCTISRKSDSGTGLGEPV